MFTEFHFNATVSHLGVSALYETTLYNVDLKMLCFQKFFNFSLTNQYASGLHMEEIFSRVYRNFGDYGNIQPYYVEININK